MNAEKRLTLISKIKAMETHEGCEILLSIEDFFEGYTSDQCNICANNRKNISTTEFRQRLDDIRTKETVSGVFVRFYEYTDALEYGDSWIGSDSIYIITSDSADEVRSWFEDFEVTDTWEERDPTKFMNCPSIPEGHRLVAAWWD